MRHLTCLLLASLAGATSICAQGIAAPSYVIDNVSVIDVASGSAHPGQRVVITGRRIAAVGPAGQTPAPANATMVDGRGRFLIPGLWDMHVHATGGPGTTQASALFLANGVTGIRDMGTGVDGLLQWRAEVERGTLPGPRIVGAGVLVDGTPIVYPAAITHAVATPDEARKAVDSLVGRGVNFIKAYEMLRPDVYLALAAQARVRGVSHAGHLPLAVSAEDAVRAGHRSFEHLRNLEVACSSKADSLRAVALDMLEKGKNEQGMRLRSAIHGALRPRAFETYDEGRCDALIRLMAEHGTWATPNLVLATQGWFRHDTTEAFQKWVRYLPEPSRTRWRRASTPATTPQAQGPPRAVAWAMQLTKRLHDAGVGTLAGTDYPIEAMVPGAALHEELALLVRVGLTPAEALRVGTLNPATYLGMTDSLGVVAAGKLADLVLLDANPLDDIRNVARVRSVWSGGRYLSREAIDSLLQAAIRMR
jgi:imidazolonepropionase-like amidohydrolase